MLASINHSYSVSPFVPLSPHDELIGISLLYHTVDNAWNNHHKPTSITYDKGSVSMYVHIGSNVSVDLFPFGFTFVGSILVLLHTHENAYTMINCQNNWFQGYFSHALVSCRIPILCQGMVCIPRTIRLFPGLHHYCFVRLRLFGSIFCRSNHGLPG